VILYPSDSVIDYDLSFSYDGESRVGNGETGLRWLAREAGRCCVVPKEEEQENGILKLELDSKAQLILFQQCPSGTLRALVATPSIVFDLRAMLEKLSILRAMEFTCYMGPQLTP
jgi:hypothetical protein